MRLQTTLYSLLPILALSRTGNASTGPTDTGAVPKDESPDAPMIGFDLGTTFSCISIYSNGQVSIIKDEQNRSTFPSMISYTPEGRILFGHEAKEKAAIYPESTFYDSKRFIGRTLEPGERKDLNIYPFKYEIENDRFYYVRDVNGVKRRESPEQISGLVLMFLRDIAEKAIGRSFVNAVITVPAYFTSDQRQGTMDAATIAKIHAVRIVSEPVASALSYFSENETTSKPKLIAVFDMGGGTHDISIMRAEGSLYEVLSTGGVRRLGGQDFDNSILLNVLEYVKKNFSGFDASTNPVLLAKIKEQAEELKIQLSTQNKGTIFIPQFHNGTDLKYTLTRAAYESLCMRRFTEAVEILAETIEGTNHPDDTNKKLTASQLDGIVMVGGSSKTPILSNLIYNKINVRPQLDPNPDYVVAKGAAIQHSIIQRGNVNKDILVLDTFPTDMGIETVGGVMAVVVRANTHVPSEHKQVFTTAHDNQESVLIKVYQGNRSRTKDNFFIAEFELKGIPKLHRGEAQVEVTFTISVNHIIKVEAKDKNNEKNVVVRNITTDVKNFSQDDLARMSREAEENIEKDRLFVEVTRLRTELESGAYHVMRSIDDPDTGKLLSDEVRDKARHASNEMLVWLQKYGEEATKEELVEKSNEFAPIISEVSATGPSPATQPKSSDEVPVEEEGL